MTFRIRDNENVSKKWKIISNILFNWIFLPAFIMHGLLHLILDKEKYYNSLYGTIFLFVAVGAMVVSLTLNITYWLKPKWFENKN